MTLGTRRGSLFNLREYILPYIDIYTYSYLRRQGRLARGGESATGKRGVCEPKKYPLDPPLLYYLLALLEALLDTIRRR